VLLACFGGTCFGDLHTAKTFSLHGEGTQARRMTPEVFEAVIVQLSNDAKFRSGVTPLFNSDDDESCGQGKGTDPTYIETNHGRGVPAGS
jgi:hypothetical protein